MNDYFNEHENFITDYKNQELLPNSSLEQYSDNFSYNDYKTNNNFNFFEGQENIIDSNFAIDSSSKDIINTDFNYTNNEPYIDIANNYQAFSFENNSNEILKSSPINDFHYLENYSPNYGNDINLSTFNNVSTGEYINTNTSNNVLYDSILSTKYLKNIDYNNYSISSLNENNLNTLDINNSQEFTPNNYDDNNNNYDFSNLTNIQTSSELVTGLSFDNYENNNIIQNNDYNPQVNDININNQLNNNIGNEYNGNYFQNNNYEGFGEYTSISNDILNEYKPENVDLNSSMEFDENGLCSEDFSIENDIKPEVSIISKPINMGTKLSKITLPTKVLPLKEDPIRKSKIIIPRKKKIIIPIKKKIYVKRPKIIRIISPQKKIITIPSRKSLSLPYNSSFGPAEIRASNPLYYSGNDEYLNQMTGPIYNISSQNVEYQLRNSNNQVQISSPLRYSISTYEEGNKGKNLTNNITDEKGVFSKNFSSRYYIPSRPLQTINSFSVKKLSGNNTKIQPSQYDNYLHNSINPNIYNINSIPAESNSINIQSLSSPIRYNISSVRISSPIKYNITSLKDNNPTSYNATPIPVPSQITYNITSHPVVSPIKNILNNNTINNVSYIPVQSPIRYSISSHNVISPIKYNISTVKVSSPLKYNIISNPVHPIGYNITSHSLSPSIKNKFSSTSVFSPINTATIPVETSLGYNINSHTYSSPIRNIISSAKLVQSPIRYSITTFSPIKYSTTSNNIDSPTQYNINPYTIMPANTLNSISYLNCIAPTNNYSIYNKSNQKRKAFYPVDPSMSPLRKSNEIEISRTLTPLNRSFRKSWYKPQNFRNEDDIKVTKLMKYKK